MINHFFTSQESEVPHDKDYEHSTVEQNPMSQH